MYPPFPKTKRQSQKTKISQPLPVAVQPLLAADQPLLAADQRQKERQPLLLTDATQRQKGRQTKLKVDPNRLKRVKTYITPDLILRLNRLNDLRGKIFYERPGTN